MQKTSSKTSLMSIFLACLIGIIIAFGYQFILNWRYSCSLAIWHAYPGKSVSTITGIPCAKLVLLDFFIFMPWPVENLDEVKFFREIDYNEGVEGEGGIAAVVVHTLSFFVGALVATILTRGKWIPFVIAAVLIIFPLMLASITYYNMGEGGPVWLYPSPFYLIAYIIWVTIIGLLAYVIYLSGVRLINSSKKNATT